MSQHRILKRFLLGASGMALALALAAGSAQAQQPPTAAPAEEEDEIIVVGTPGGSGIRKQDASFAITTLNAEQIDQAGPLSTADLLKVVPGVWSESTGGESGANVFVRGFPTGGDAEFLTIQLNGSPIFPPPTLSFLENSTLFRLDETVQRVEALRGGPNPVFSNGQPGLTVNFIEKEGGPEHEGLLQLSGTSFGERRVDAVFSGPLAERTYFSIGGFYRASDGIRDTQFTSEEGVQISANVTHDFERGKLKLFARYTNDRNQWILPIPIIQNPDGSLDEFPGFDAGTGTLVGNETRFGVLEIGPGEFLREDLADGRGPAIGIVGGDFEYDIGHGVTFRNRFSFTSGEANTRGLVPGGPPTTAAEFLAGFGAGAAGDFSFTSSGAALTDLSTPVIQAGWWFVDKDIESFTNEASFAKELFEGNTATIGFYFADTSTTDLWYLGNNQLLVAEPNARRLDLTLADGSQVTRDGFSGAPFFANNASYDGRNIAFFAADEWQATSKLRLDAGVRVENFNVDGAIENVDFGIDLDNDPTTLFNNSAAVLNGTFRTVSFNETEVSWTVGVNYAITDEVGVFGRINNGSRFPQFDNLRDGVTNIQQVNQYEAGVKVSTDRVGLFGTFFFADFEGLPFQRFVNGVNINDIGDSRSFGVELEGYANLIGGLSVDFSGTFLDGEFTELVNSAGQDLDGNRIQRQPRWQIRGTPNYRFRLPFGTGKVFTTVSYIGDRFADIENLQLLPSYVRLDAGVSFALNERIEFLVTGDNLTDELAITEGNPRVIGSQGVGPILARPILGRSVRFSLAYKF